MRTMLLEVYLPTGIFLKQKILQISAEGSAGEFCLKPRHIDFLSNLVPGILAFVSHEGDEQFLAVAGGLLVKQQGNVWVASRHVASGPLGSLHSELSKIHDSLDQREKKNLSAVAKLEVGFLKKMMDFSGRHSV